MGVRINHLHLRVDCHILPPPKSAMMTPLFQKTPTVNCSPFVAHHTWRSHGVSPHRLRTHRGHRGEPVRGRLVRVSLCFTLLHTASHGATRLSSPRLYLL